MHLKYLNKIFAIEPLFPSNLPGSVLYSSALFITLSYFHLGELYSHIVLSEKNKLQLLNTSHAIFNYALCCVSLLVPLVYRTHLSLIEVKMQQIDGLFDAAVSFYDVKPVKQRRKLGVDIGGSGEGAHSLRSELIFSLCMSLNLVVSYFCSNFTDSLLLTLWNTSMSWLQVFYMGVQLSYIGDTLRRLNLCLGHLRLYPRLMKYMEPGPKIGQERPQCYPALYLTTMSTLNTIHHLIYRVSHHFNSYFGLIILLQVPRALFFTVLPLYVLLIDVIILRNVDVYAILCHARYLVHFIAPLVYITRKCSVSEKQSEAVISSIYDLLEEQQDKSHIANELVSFSFYLTNRKIEFNMCHVFKINTSLLVNITEFILTYLLVFVQFTEVPTTKTQE
ncbi:hypothetical protein M8J75_010031 [Diaphorina citri]|nr:hypothetical protein M8J75_010031 [Diaphorina citri]